MRRRSLPKIVLFEKLTEAVQARSTGIGSEDRQEVSNIELEITVEEAQGAIQRPRRRQPLSLVDFANPRELEHSQQDQCHAARADRDDDPAVSGRRPDMECYTNPACEIIEPPRVSEHFL